MSRQRLELRGIAASPGVALGHAVVLDAQNLPVPHLHIESDEFDFQCGRLAAAIERSRRELQAIRDRLSEDSAAEYRLILDAHLMMHRDDLLVYGSLKAIRNDGINAEWAVERTVGTICQHLESAPDTYVRERAADVQQVGRRIVAELVGRDASLPPLTEGAVLVVNDLHPADAVRLIEVPVAALVTGLGSATSHMAILARTLEIPAVVGVQGILDQVGSGDTMIVDAMAANVVLNASPQERREAGERALRYRRFTRRLRETTRTGSSTHDGVHVELLANVDLPAEAALAVEEGSEGIGLYRTEFLFMNRPSSPDEEEQYQVYSDIVRVTAPRPVTLRTIDVGGDSLTIDDQATSGPNPALGLRGIRLTLSRRDLFHAQLCAALRAAAHGPVRLMFPLVSGLSELRRAREALAEARADLQSRGCTYGELQVGVMIELPAAVVMADRLAAECDFFSVGTNDLVQYALAVDRANPQVAYLASPLDPAVLRMLDLTLRASRDANIPISICGDMAADAFVLPLVLGLGYRSLSVPLSAMPLVREVLRRLDTGEARVVGRLSLDCDSSEDVGRLLHQHFEKALGEVWDEAGTGRFREGCPP